MAKNPYYVVDPVGHYEISDVTWWFTLHVSDFWEGGLHPVTIGDTFNDRYTIRFMLAHGGSCSVWVARDLVLDRWVSLKILKAATTDPTREIRALEALAEHAPEGLNTKHIVKLLDHFRIDGPNGRHQCLVLELLGPSIGYIIEYCRKHSVPEHPKAALPVLKQAFRALSFIHKAGFAHGDFNVNNIVFAPRRLANLPEEQLYEILGSPRSGNVLLHGVQPLDIRIPHQFSEFPKWRKWWSILEDDEDEYPIRVIDFGEAFPLDSVQRCAKQPITLKPPERWLAETFDYRIDLWCAGLTIQYYVLTSLPCGRGEDAPEVAAMIQFSGSLPAQWEAKWKQMKRTAKQNGQADEIKRRKFDALEDSWQWIKHSALKELIPIIKGLTALWPSDRMSANEAYAKIAELTDRYLKHSDDDHEPVGEMPIFFIRNDEWNASFPSERDKLDRREWVYDFGESISSKSDDSGECGNSEEAVDSKKANTT